MWKNLTMIIILVLLLMGCSSTQTTNQTQPSTSQMPLNPESSIRLDGEESAILKEFQGEYTDFYHQNSFSMSEILGVYEAKGNDKVGIVTCVEEQEINLWRIKTNAQTEFYIKKLTSDEIEVGLSLNKMTPLFKFDSRAKKISDIEFTKYQPFIGEYFCSADRIRVKLGLASNNRAAIIISNDETEQVFVCETLRLSNDKNQLFFDVLYNDIPLHFRIAKISEDAILFNGEGEYKRQLMLKRVKSDV
ncbi:hypothetical protein [Vagococcus zengguangii]|uniref:Uncharacterized protein n=1 Tax=Vagococcus zengguangii TaxID=2571750 RepID=A0A4D7CVB7_9ENTE|nr:hypothetical protein [Vagococcus zengguangii]QCI86231.1 hypothetical protein FA707_04305 [Vagococcus zengguangii]TLG79660.1 hypothetical protein FE258_08135 [Vagococcus zengguangii]